MSQQKKSSVLYFILFKIFIRRGRKGFICFKLISLLLQCVKHGFISPDTNRGIRLVNFDMANLFFDLLAHWQNQSVQQKSVHES